MGDDSIKKNISKNIGKYREARGMSQKELAQRLGVVPSRISNWETGANCPTIDILFEVCEILSVSINDIYGVYPDSKLILQYDEKELIEKYRLLDAEAKEMVNSFLENAFKMSEERKPKEGQLILSTTPGYKYDIVENGKLIPWVTESVYDDINAAHARTDKTNTPADIQHDENIMDDENF